MIEATHHPDVYKRPVCGLVLALSRIASGQTDRWYGRTSTLPLQAFQSSDRRFTLEYPKKDWDVVSGGLIAAATLAQRRSEAVVVIERTRLNQALAPEDITELFVQLEVETIRQQQPGAAIAETRVIDADERRVIIIDFSRPGLRGPERVRQYSIPHGTDLYRFICSGTPGGFVKHESVFAHFAASFKISASTEK